VFTEVNTDIGPLVNVGHPTEAGQTPDRVARRFVTLLRAAAREPLVHFLTAGVVLLALSAAFGRSTALAGPQNRIQVTATMVQRMRDTWTSQWGQAPTAAQMQTLIDDYVREEILFREAMASGLDRDDTIIRRHLAQKIEFLTQGVAAATEPSETELAQFFAAHTAAYREPPKVAFSHIYFSASKRGVAAATDATNALRHLQTGTVPRSEAVALGDSFMLQSEYPLKTRDEIRELFGPPFADALFTLPVGQWSGPVVSSYGTHLVRIEQLAPARIPTLDEVRDRVATDFNDERVRTAVDGYYQKLRARYRVDVDREALGHP
jgi:hypothetical protein